MKRSQRRTSTSESDPHGELTRAESSDSKSTSTSFIPLLSSSSSPSSLASEPTCCVCCSDAGSSDGDAALCCVEIRTLQNASSENIGRKSVEYLTVSGIYNVTYIRYYAAYCHTQNNRRMTDVTCICVSTSLSSLSAQAAFCSTSSTYARKLSAL